MIVDGSEPTGPGMQSAPLRTPSWRCVESATDYQRIVESLGTDDLHVWLLQHGRASGPLAVVARYARCDPDRLKLQFNAYGKPSLAGSALAFNISHSGTQTLVALGLGLRVGVDLEHRRRVARRAALLARCFTPSERARIEASDADALLRYWAAKEAVVKAIGRGIAYGLASIEIVENAVGDLHLAKLGGPAGPASAWRLTGGRVGPHGYFALAHDGPARVLSYYADGFAQD